MYATEDEVVSELPELYCVLTVPDNRCSINVITRVSTSKIYGIQIPLSQVLKDKKGTPIIVAPLTTNEPKDIEMIPLLEKYGFVLDKTLYNWFQWHCGSKNLYYIRLGEKALRPGAHCVD